MLNLLFDLVSRAFGLFLLWFVALMFNSVWDGHFAIESAPLPTNFQCIEFCRLQRCNGCWRRLLRRRRRSLQRRFAPTSASASASLQRLRRHLRRCNVVLHQCPRRRHRRCNVVLHQCPRRHRRCRCSDGRSATLQLDVVNLVSIWILVWISNIIAFWRFCCRWCCRCCCHCCCYRFCNNWVSFSLFSSV